MKFSRLADLQGKSIGIVRGSSYGEEFDQAAYVVFQAELDANINQARFAKLLRKRNDALVIYSQAQNSTLLENDLNKKFGALASTESGAMKTRPFCVVPQSVSTRSVHFAFAPGYNDSFLEQLNAALIKAKASGELGKIHTGTLPK